MGKNIGYIRVSTDKQTTDNQKLAILDYSQKHQFIIHDFIAAEISSTKSKDERKINKLLKLSRKGDKVIITELSRLGRSVIDVISIINELMNNGIILHIIKEGIILDNSNKNAFSDFQITIFSAFSELERNIISQRTKESLLARKKMGIKLGKPKGIIQSSIFDKYQDQIKKEFLMGIPISKIYKNVGISTYQNLYKYIQKRKRKWKKKED